MLNHHGSYEEDEGACFERRYQLEAGLIKLKPAWNGLRVSRGIPPKEVGPITEKNIEVGLKSMETGRGRASAQHNNKAGLHPPCPFGSEPINR